MLRPFDDEVVDVDNVIGEPELYAFPNERPAALKVLTSTGLLKASVNDFAVQSKDTKPVVDVNNDGGVRVIMTDVAISPVVRASAILLLMS